MLSLIRQAVLRDRHNSDTRHNPVTYLKLGDLGQRGVQLSVVGLRRGAAEQGHGKVERGHRWGSAKAGAYSSTWSELQVRLWTTLSFGI